MITDLMVARLFIFLILLSFTTKVKSSEIYDAPKKEPKAEFKKTNFQVGAGLMGSVLYLSRNVKENNDALGYTFSANYSGKNLLRLSVQYTYYKPINIEPTWYTIKANTIETNLEVLARFKNNKTLLYPFVGLSYNTFQGFFTGQNDFLNLRERYKSNTSVKSQWLGLNIGTGLEHSIGPVVFFVDYRMRVGQMDKKAVSYNIMDVCYGGGIRLMIHTIKLNKTKRPKHGFRDRYHVS